MNTRFDEHFIKPLLLLKTCLFYLNLSNTLQKLDSYYAHGLLERP